MYFAPNVAEITKDINFEDSILTIDFPFQEHFEPSPEWGWWGVYVIIEYESPNITTPICLRLYTANQSQIYPQYYSFTTPNFLFGTPIISAIHS